MSEIGCSQVLAARHLGCEEIPKSEDDNSDKTANVKRILWLLVITSWVVC
jgi:hypothetical protein